MKRLTTISEITGLPMLSCFRESSGESACVEDCEQFVEDYCKGCGVHEAITSLHAYEDTGLTPEQVQELANAKHDGRLAVLLCGIGDSVFRIFNTRGCENCTLSRSCDGIRCPPPKFYEQKFSFAHLDDLRDVRFTPEEAEAALREMEGTE
jgi:hypothetical protein